MLKLCKINASADGVLGLHLSRAPWDPYPWVSGIQDTSSAYLAGIRTGDTVLEVNGFDIIGQKILDLAAIIRTHWTSGASEIQFLVWRNRTDTNNVNQQSLQKFVTCLQNIAQLLECPICLEVVKPPGWQCCNGHVLCNSCRLRTTKCSICRVTLGPRGRCLLSDKLFTLLVETFPCNVSSKPKETSVKDQQQKSNTLARPIAAIRYIKHKSKQIVSIKVDAADVSQDGKESSPALAANCTASPYKSYHCPTGKSCLNPISAEPYPLQTALYSEWDVLTHLRRVHQLSVTQHYGTYGERIQVQFMNKSISCISLARLTTAGKVRSILNASSVRPPTEESLPELCDTGVPSSPNQVLMSSMSSTTEQGEDAGTKRSILSNRRTSAASGDEVFANAIDRTNDKISEVEMFFVAKISIPRTEQRNVDGGSKGDCNAIAVGNERCAIFIWYCGSEENAKKFQAVIECKRSTDAGVIASATAATVTSKWKGFIHPLTKTWNSIRCQKEFFELEFDVANFFDIVIKVK